MSPAGSDERSKPDTKRRTNSIVPVIISRSMGFPRQHILHNIGSLMKQYFLIADRLFHLKKVTGYWRYTVFIVRSLILHRQLQQLMAFFASEPIFLRFSETHPCVYEQATRSFFYRGSTPSERVNLIQEHLRFCAAEFTAEAFDRIYFQGGLDIWSGEFNNEALSIRIHFDSSLKKEGIMVAAFYLGGTRIYHIDFWFGSDRNGARAITIGTLQGIEEGLPILGALAKDFHGYRPKNLVLRVVRLLAAQLHIDRIYAVSDAGHFSGNYFTPNMQLKSSFNRFWRETGGTIAKDTRFFELNAIEPQKSIEDIKSSKRSLYRKRFALLAEFDAEINSNLQPCIRTRPASVPSNLL